ncbi:MAG: hypothetical protein UT34_C0001G0080 [candidate division WS6 bacterium GW2011_GWF2_39_15]|uniref:Rod shape-determining protein RodA n=1 Tax=candidate division WS6 bacterium GW2011_GWF2_39_15 TaxID=1619100 RepID=A0A0G0Q6J5_9BACT|nr:MAG: hypothetical protein UT34_C0001G0080 [candidate division WS6 bacterium GW2011_GWF2_39_15]
MLITKRAKKRLVNPFLILPAVIISAIGVITLLSTQVTVNGQWEMSNIVYKQLAFGIVGVLLFIGLSRFDFEFLKYKPVLAAIYILTLILLVLTLVFGEQVKGAQRWLTIGGIQVQPSEFAKLTVIVITAYIMTLQDKLSEYFLAIISFLLVLPIVILVYLQPHGSMSILLLAIWGVTVFFSLKEQFRNFTMLALIICVVSGIWGSIVLKNPMFLGLIFLGFLIFIFALFSKKNWQILSLVLFGLSIILGLTISYSWEKILLPYQRERITSFVNPEGQDQTSAFNVDQAKIAIGSGKLFGKGIGKGTQASRDFLPEHQTDFIFASYAEQVGLIGSGILLSLYGIMLYTIFKFPVTAKGDIYTGTIVVALGMKILIEIFINLGTNTGIIPATGIPLPLLSAGGSITLATFLSLGLIQSITNNKHFVDN